MSKDLPGHMASSLENFPHLVQLAFHALELEQVPEDELVCAHRVFCDDNIDRPVYLQYAVCQCSRA